MDPWIHIDIMPFQDDLMIFPFVKIPEIILPHDQCKLEVRVFFRQHGQGIHRIIRLWQTEFHIGGFESRIALRGPVHQFEPVPVIESGLFIFKGVMRCYHQPDLIQVTVLCHMVSNDQMAYMDRVKGAKV